MTNRPLRSATLRSGTGTPVPDFARAQLRRQRANFALFLGPALILLACFFIAPVGHRPGARVHRHGPHARGHDADAGQLRADGDARHAAARIARDHRDIRALDACDLQRHVRASARAGDDGHSAGSRRVLPCGLAAAAHEPVGRLRAAVALGRRSQRAWPAEPGTRPRARDGAARPAQQPSAARRSSSPTASSARRSA